MVQQKFAQSEDLKKYDFNGNSMNRGPGPD
jgi:hypothetical protein